MGRKTMVLRKQDHWYIISSGAGEESELLLALLEFAEQTEYNIERGEVEALLQRLGWTLEIHDNLNVA